MPPLTFRLPLCSSATPPRFTHRATMSDERHDNDPRDEGMPRDAFPEDALPDETGPFNEEALDPETVEGEPLGFWDRREVYPVIFLIIIGIAYFFMGCDGGGDDVDVSVRVENGEGVPVANAEVGVRPSIALSGGQGNRVGTAQVTRDAQFVVQRPGGAVSPFVRTVTDDSNTFTFVVSP